MKLFIKYFWSQVFNFYLILPIWYVRMGSTIFFSKRTCRPDLSCWDSYYPHSANIRGHVVLYLAKPWSSATNNESENGNFPLTHRRLLLRHDILMEEEHCIPCRLAADYWFDNIVSSEKSFFIIVGDPPQSFLHCPALLTRLARLERNFRQNTVR